MVEKEKKDHVLLGGGPLGLGDPDDRRLRKAEKDLIIPKLLREEARRRCTETFELFYECSKSAGIAVSFKCKDQKKTYDDCLLSWCKNSDFVNEITNKYLEDRKHYRLTGEAVKKIRETPKSGECPLSDDISSPAQTAEDLKIDLAPSILNSLVLEDIHLTCYSSRQLQFKNNFVRKVSRSRKIKITIEMSSIPQGAFAAVKVKQLFESNQTEFSKEEEKEENKFEKHFLSNGAAMEQSPLKYSSKLMNSIWGLYNQYSVHNLKKNKDSGDFAGFNNQCM